MGEGTRKSKGAGQYGSEGGSQVRRPGLIVAMVLGALAVLAIPSSALAANSCGYATSGGNSALVGPLTVGSGTVTVYHGRGVTDPTAGGSPTAAGVCADNVAPGPPGQSLDGGYAEVGAGEDQATGDADPGAVSGQPDGYVVVDGSDDNSDPSGFSDGYAGVSNWETGTTRTSPSNCTDPSDGQAGPDHGTAASSNSGGCEGVDNGPWVYVGDDVPTPVCGNTSGDSWYGSSGQGTPDKRDGCSIP
jgi:hypothetical protein